MALWQGTTKGPPSLPVNDVLVWHAVLRAAELACVSFELMGANTRRLAAFKSKFNPRLIGYLEVTWGNLTVRTLRSFWDATRRVR